MDIPYRYLFLPFSLVPRLPPLLATAVTTRRKRRRTGIRKSVTMDTVVGLLFSKLQYKVLN